MNKNPVKKRRLSATLMCNVLIYLRTAREMEPVTHIDRRLGAWSHHHYK